VRDESERIRRFVLVALVGATSLLFAWMIREYLLALFIAALLAGTLQPLYQKLRARLGGREHLAAAIVIALFSLLGIVPLAGLATLAGVQAAGLFKAAEQLARKGLEGGPIIHCLAERFPRLSWLEQYQAPIVEKLGELGSKAGTAVVGAFTQAAGETLSFLLALFVMLYAAFFFLVSGRETLKKILYLSPLPAEDEDKIVGRFLSVTRATVKGTLVVGIVQGTLGGIGLGVAGIRGAVFWGVMMTVLSVIPSLGTAIVWVPAVVYLFAAGRTLAGILLLLWCMLAVASIDNLLRPALVGKDTKMPDLLVLVSTLGGITFFGIAGFVIGPLIASMFVTVWEIYGHVFRDVLPGSPPPSGPSKTAGAA